jgi:dihydroorotate dehydrogenase (NAD+) catalytic subunit
MTTSSVQMSVKVGGLELCNPVLAASGTFGYGREFSPYMDLNRIGGLVTKGVSLKPRLGNPPQRVVETAGGMLNAIGLANVGLKDFLADKMPWLSKLGTKVVVNLYGESLEEFSALASGLEDQAGVAALELNVSCPNVKEGGLAFGVNPDSVAEVTRTVKAASGKPVWVKLTPNVTDPVLIAKAARDAGADALSMINTLLGMAIDPVEKKPVLANVFGGLSGPAIKPVGLRMVYQVSRAVDIPVIGLGGIMTGRDAAEYMLAGASAVQVGTANFSDPTSCLRIAEELAGFCTEQGISRVSQLVGGLDDKPLPVCGVKE